MMMMMMMMMMMLMIMMMILDYNILFNKITNTTQKHKTQRQYFYLFLHISVIFGNDGWDECIHFGGSGRRVCMCTQYITAESKKKKCLKTAKMA